MFTMRNLKKFLAFKVVINNNLIMKTIFTTFIFCMFLLNIYSQGYVFEYDDSGNRIQRIYIGDF